MYPILFSVGGFKMHSYGLFAALAMIAAGLIVQRLSRRLGVDPGAALELTVAAIIGGLVGARIYWAAEHWTELRGDLGPRPHGRRRVHLVRRSARRRRSR